MPDSSNTQSQAIYIYELQRKLSQVRQLSAQCKKRTIQLAASPGPLKLYSIQAQNRYADAHHRLSSAMQTLMIETGEQKCADKIRTQIEQAQQRSALEQEQLNRKRARTANISGPLDLSVEKARGVLRAASMDMFVLRQDVRALVDDIASLQCSSCSKNTSSETNYVIPPHMNSHRKFKKWDEVALRAREARESWQAQHNRVAQI